MTDQPTPKHLPTLTQSKYDAFRMAQDAYAVFAEADNLLTMKMPTRTGDPDMPYNWFEEFRGIHLQMADVMAKLRKHYPPEEFARMNAELRRARGEEI